MSLYFVRTYLHIFLYLVSQRKVCVHYVPVGVCRKAFNAMVCDTVMEILMWWRIITTHGWTEWGISEDSWRRPTWPEHSVYLTFSTMQIPHKSHIQLFQSDVVKAFNLFCFQRMTRPLTCTVCSVLFYTFVLFELVSLLYCGRTDVVYFQHSMSAGCLSVSQAWHTCTGDAQSPCPLACQQCHNTCWAGPSIESAHSRLTVHWTQCKNGDKQ